MQSTEQKLREALQEIIEIKNKMEGSDWEEIEEAREIARQALALPTAALVGERDAFEKWWKGDLVDWRGFDSVPALHAWRAWQARAALSAVDVKPVLQGALNVLGCLEYGITGVDSWPCEDSVEAVVHRIRKVLEES